MAAFKKTFTKREGSAPRPGTRASFDAARGKTFTKKPWAPKDASSEGFKTHFKAACSKCGKSCEVPFKPVNGKPIFCRDCFVPTDERAPRSGKSFGAREYARPAAAQSSPENAAILKQLEILNAKMERVIALLSAQAND